MFNILNKDYNNKELAIIYFKNSDVKVYNDLEFSNLGKRRKNDAIWKEIEYIHLPCRIMVKSFEKGRKV